MMMFILICAQVFSLAFRGLQGEDLISAMFEFLPGGVAADIWFLMLLIFVLGFFIEWIEISYIAVPLFLPVFVVAGRGPGVARDADLREPADLVPHAAVRLGAVLPARRGAARDHHAPHLRRRDPVHRHAGARAWCWCSSSRRSRSGCRRRSAGRRQAGLLGESRPYGQVRLHDAPGQQDGAAAAHDPEEHLAQLLSRRQDRRAGPERLGQVHAAEDHGGRGRGDRRRGDPHAGHPGRLPAAGAGARRGEDGARGGRGGARRGRRGEEAARGGLRRVFGGGRGLRQARRRAGAPGGDRQHRRYRPGTRNRRRCAALAALGREDRNLVRRGKKKSRAVQAAAVQARPAAARRADQPPRCRERGVAGAVPAALSRHRGGGDARPLLPRQRRRLDPGTGPRHGHSLGGQLLLVAGAEGKAPRGRVEAGRGAHQVHEGRARMGAAERQGPAGEVQGAPRALRGTVAVRAPAAQRNAGNLHPGRRAPRQRGDRVHGCLEGLRRPAADRQALVHGAAGRDRRHHRAERRGEIDFVQIDHWTRKSRTRERSRSARR